VNCLAVVGHRAYIGLSIAHGTGTSAHVGEQFTFVAEDNGLAGAGDRIDNSAFSVSGGSETS